VNAKQQHRLSFYSKTDSALKMVIHAADETDSVEAANEEEAKKAGVSTDTPRLDLFSTADPSLGQDGWKLHPKSPVVSGPGWALGGGAVVQVLSTSSKCHRSYSHHHHMHAPHAPPILSHTHATRITLNTHHPKYIPPNMYHPQVRGRIFRPTQDCRLYYGRAVRLAEIKQLSQELYVEEPLEEPLGESIGATNAYNSAAAVAKGLGFDGTAGTAGASAAKERGFDVIGARGRGFNSIGSHVIAVSMHHPLDPRRVAHRSLPLSSAPVFGFVDGFAAPSAWETPLGQ
jgi:hypothetical protein